MIFHNTMTSSDYGWQKYGSFDPRPNYVAVLLRKKLMGNTVHASGEAIRSGAHVFCHNRVDGKELLLGENDELPELTGVTREDAVGIAPGGCTFIIL